MARNGIIEIKLISSVKLLIKTIRNKKLISLFLFLLKKDQVFLIKLNILKLFESSFIIFLFI